MTVPCTCNTCAGNYPVTSLEDFRISMCCVDPWSFWGWDHTSLRKHRGVCKDVVLERPTGSVMGRSNIRSALLASEQMFTNELGYAPVETWFSEEIGLNPGYWNGHGRTGLLRTSHSRVQAVGAPVVGCMGEVDFIFDPESEFNASPGLNEFAFHYESPGDIIPIQAVIRFEIPAELVGDITADEICVYVPEDSRDDSTGIFTCVDLERWKVHPICVVLVDNEDRREAIITVRPWLLARPDLYDAYLPHAAPISAFNDLTLDPTVLANYLDRLSICRCTIDRDQAGLVKYNPVGCEGDCNPCGCTGCDHDTACGLCEPVNFCIENGRAGLLRPDYFACTPNMQSVCVHYKAGDCSRNWTRDIAIYAATQLCGVCECGWGCIKQWGVDLASESAKTSLAFERMNHHLGTKRGEIHAANIIGGLPKRVLAGI